VRAALHPSNRGFRVVVDTFSGKAGNIAVPPLAACRLASLAIRKCIKNKRDIKSLSYIRPAVYRARDAQLDTERAIAAKGQSGGGQGISDEQGAKDIAFYTRKMGRRLAHEELWLVDYETAHGLVAS